MQTATERRLCNDGSDIAPQKCALMSQVDLATTTRGGTTTRANQQMPEPSAGAREKCHAKEQTDAATIHGDDGCRLCDDDCSAVRARGTCGRQAVDRILGSLGARRQRRDD